MKKNIGTLGYILFAAFVIYLCDFFVMPLFWSGR